MLEMPKDIHFIQMKWVDNQMSTFLKIFNQICVIEQRVKMEIRHLYSVKNILARRTNSNGFLQYKIHWEGYSQEQATWEPKQNLEFIQQWLAEIEKNGLVVKKYEEEEEQNNNVSTHYQSSINLPTNHQRVSHDQQDSPFIPYFVQKRKAFENKMRKVKIEIKKQIKAQIKKQDKNKIKKQQLRRKIKKFHEQMQNKRNEIIYLHNKKNEEEE